MNEEACENTDREIWREHPDDFYSNSIHVTKENGIGINVGGYVIVMPAKRWHDLARLDSPKPRTALEIPAIERNGIF